MGKSNKQTAAASEATTVTETGAVVEQHTTDNAVSVFKPKIIRVVTKPLFKMAQGVTRYFKFDSAMFVGKEIKESGSVSKKEPATLAYVTDLETGEQGQFIVSAVLKSIMAEDYAGDAYVGKSFAIRQQRIPGKAYNGIDLAEIEV